VSHRFDKAIPATEVAFMARQYFAQNVSARFDAPDQHPIAIGQGYDTISGQAREDSVKRVALKPFDEHSQGGQAEFDLEYFSSYSSVRRELSMSAAASAGLGTFRGTASAKLLREQSADSYYNYVLVKMVALNPAMRMESYSFTKPAADALRKPVDFRKRFGNSFFAGGQSGGNFNALLISESGSQREFARIQAAFQMAVGGFKKIKLEAAFSETIEKLSTTSRVTVKQLRHGGVGALPEETPAALIAYARQFGKEVGQGDAAAKPAAVVAFLEDYSRVTASGGLPSYVDMQDQEAILLVYVEYIAEASQLLNALDVRLEQIEFYLGLDQDIVKQQRQQVADAIAAVLGYVDDGAATGRVTARALPALPRLKDMINFGRTADRDMDGAMLVRSLRQVDPLRGGLSTTVEVVERSGPTWQWEATPIQLGPDGSGEPKTSGFLVYMPQGDPPPERFVSAVLKSSPQGDEVYLEHYRGTTPKQGGEKGDIVYHCADGSMHHARPILLGNRQVWFWDRPVY
jgi:hypothetical protein